MKPAAVLFTDLDGTFIDHDTYDPGPALPALRRLQAAGVRVVFCSSKTWSEQQALMAEHGIQVDAIVENGAAIHHVDGRLEVLGAGYATVRAAALAAAGEVGTSIHGQGDMVPEEMADYTGLSLDAAARALDREYSEPVIVDSEHRDAFVAAVARRGLRALRGARFTTVVGVHDKGTAVARMRESVGPSVRSYAIGDHRNDREMLSAVDVPMQVQRPDGTWLDLGVEGIVRVDAIGPAGWVLGADHLLGELARSG